MQWRFCSPNGEETPSVDLNERLSADRGRKQDSSAFVRAFLRFVRLVSNDREESSLAVRKAEPVAARSTSRLVQPDYTFLSDTMIVTPSPATQSSGIMLALADVRNDT